VERAGDIGIAQQVIVERMVAQRLAACRPVGSGEVERVERAG